jgi:hypothetical protein
MVESRYCKMAKQAKRESYKNAFMLKASEQVIAPKRARAATFLFSLRVKFYGVARRFRAR